MRLRSKVVTMLIVAFGLFTAADLAIQHFVVFPSFAELARVHARADLERTRDAIDRDAAQLVRLSRDWAQRDASARLRPDVLRDAELDLLCIADASGRLTHAVAPAHPPANGTPRTSPPTEGGPPPDDSGAGDPEESADPTAAAASPLDLPVLHERVLPPDHPFAAGRDDADGHAGLIQTAAGPLMFATRRLDDAQGAEGGAGTLVLGRLLGTARMQAISAGTHARAVLHQVDGSDLPEAERHLLDALRAAPYEVALAEPRRASVTALSYVRDGESEPIALLRIEGGSEILAHAAMANGFAVASLVTAGALTLGLIVVVLQLIVIGPVGRLTNEATRIGATGDLRRSVAMERTDEIGVLSRELDGMVKRLAASRAALLDAARASGMAEVASGVLHNVGNVLNSLSVSADLLVERVERSELTRLDSLESLLEAHADDLPEFLAEAGRSEHLREFVAQLAQQRRMESAATRAELERLQANLTHVEHIIASQQSLARGTAITEPVAVQTLIEDATAMVGPAFREDGIVLRVETESIPVLTIDRVRLLQVLLNLLANARDAVQARARGDRHVEVRAAHRGDVVRIEIHDSGDGFETDTAARLFAQGFTTKERGNGIGLHFCAVAVKCMNGLISAHSDGPGRGATFTIELRTADATASKELAHV